MVETEERLSGSRIVLPEMVREKMASHQCEVLAVGEMEFCDDPDDCERPANVHGCLPDGETWVHVTDDRLTPGAWVYVAPRSLVDAGDATDKRYFVRVDDVVGIFVQED